MDESDPKKVMIEELEWELKWQWKWEKKYRRLYYGVTWLSWLSSFGILVLIFYQLQLGDDLQRWVILAVAVLSMLSVSLPVLSMAFRFQQRQQVYDEMARKYSLLRTELRMGTITAEEALEEFKKIHGKPTEKVIRETV